MATTVARLQAVLSADTRDFDRGMRGSESRMRRVGQAAKVGLAIGVGVGIVALQRSVLAARDAEVSQTKLENQLNASGISWERHKDQIESTIAAHSRLSGFDDEDLQDSFTNLVRTTGNVNKALELNATAMDLARGKGISLEAASNVLGKVFAGNTGILARYGIIIDKGSTATEALGQIQEKFSGQAQTYGDTTAGAQAKFQVATENLQEAIGKGLLPVLTELLKHMTSFVTWAEKNSGQAKLLAIAIGGLTAALIAAKIAQLALNLAVLANPYVAAGASVIVFTALMVILWQKFENARLAIIAFVARFSPLAAAFLLVKNNGDDVAAMFEKLKKTPAMEAITTILKAWVSALGTIVDAIKWLIKKIPDIPSLPKPPDFTPWNSEMKKRPPVNPTGPPGPQGPVGGGLQGAIAVGHGMGLSVSSLFRPGDPGDHGKGKAVDMAGSLSAMARFASAMFGSGKDVIYGNLPFWQDNGRMIQGWLGNMGLRNDHLDHVHYSVFDKGGWLKPGLTLAYNGTGAPERVGGGGDQTIVVQLGDTTLARLVRNAKGKFEQRNGPGSF